MQLLKVKLAGFKSFVDPTTIETPSALVAVVGPNGCGKSNVIDAITWVMGESSPKYLRGESLTDVIFNGANTRKPVGQASVELIFDNSDGTISGEYAKFAEISIKRVIDRDSDSTYYLNGTRCRKRDALDIFSHTGISARGYTIIGQNTIVEMAEAKPDQLRAHLERASGIAKYKERRHETALRIQHTQENLARVNDVCLELEKQLSKLKQQAQTAEKFKTLKEEERQLKAQLYGVQWRTLDAQMNAHTLQIKQEETGLEARNSEILAADLAIETARLGKEEANEHFEAIQRTFYAIENDISRLEQDIAHQKEREQQWRNDLAQTENQWQTVQAELNEANQQLNTLNADLQQLEPAYQAASDAVSRLQAELNTAENTLHASQHQWDEFNQKIAKANQVAQVEKNRSEYLDKKAQDLNKRLAKLAEDSKQFDFDQLQAECETLSLQREAVKQQLNEQQTALQTVRQHISTEQTAQHTATRELDQLRNQLQQARGQQSSLQALQQTALGQRDQRITAWMNQHQLQQKSRLAQHIQVEAGWELAVEKVLGLALQAICVDDLNAVAPLIANFKQGNVSLFATCYHEMNQANTANTLLSKVHSTEIALTSLLAGVYVADSLSDALTLPLATHESVVTRDGMWLGKNWIKILREDDPSAGIFQREQELKALAAQIAALENNQLELEAQIKSQLDALKMHEAERERIQQSCNQIQAQLSQIEAQYKAKQDRLQELQRQAQRIIAEQNECQASLAQTQDEFTQSRLLWEQALSELDYLNEKRDALVNTRDQARNQLQQLRDETKQKTEASHQLAMQCQGKRSQQAALLQNKNRFEHQAQHLVTRKETLLAELNSMSPTDAMQNALQEALDKHAELTSALQLARENREELEHTCRMLEQKRQAAEKEINHIRGRLENLRVEWQGWKVKAESIFEQMQETMMALETILENLPADITIDTWQAKVDQIAQRISRLGAINLVAIEEYATSLERKEYLDKQVQDLQAGLALLEEAIAKIDKETRARFKETFDKVNERFQALFPTIFGGGKAYLELTSDNLLECGVTMMACPPGKRNSTVQLLSGGEKSLTALALIFSIFHLNPAPFCLLDEVDAALDDANVVRFTRIVKSMVEKTQFIFISHNKIAIEMAYHLIGVTMHEPGVSRLVSVDMEKAVAMVEA